MAIRLDDPKLFGNFAAEDEDIDLLDSYFVDKPGYSYFRSNDKLWIVRAKKGMGKSALLKKVAHEKKSSNKEDIVIQIKGSDIIKNTFPNTTDIQQLIYSWQTAICSRVAVEIGKTLSLALTDDTITLVENAELEGFKEKNLIGCLVERMKRKIGRIEIDKPEMQNSIALLERYQEKKGRKVWVFVDDIDATFNNSEEESKRLSSFFTACRYLIQEVSGLYIRASIRTDVWSVISDKDESLDKVDQPQYMMDLSWSESEVKNIIVNRIKSYILTNLPNQAKFNYINNTFDNEDKLEKIMNEAFKTIMPWGTSRRKPSIIIYTLSNGRPRWAIHLCSLAGQAAVKKNKDKIGIDELTENLETYGMRRITDIVREHQHQSPQIRDFINAFAKKNVRYTTEQLLNLIQESITNKIQPTIEGVVGTPNEMDIAHFLFRMGFITAREDLSESEYKHYNFEDDHSLLNSEVNPDKGYTWEIHPSFRNALKAFEPKVVNYQESIFQKGKVTRFDNVRGFGFIETEGGKSIFVHYTAILCEGFKKLNEGEQVEFNIVQTNRGAQAQKVTILNTNNTREN